MNYSVLSWKIVCFDIYLKILIISNMTITLQYTPDFASNVTNNYTSVSKGSEVERTKLLEVNINTAFERKNLVYRTSTSLCNVLVFVLYFILFYIVFVSVLYIWLIYKSFLFNRRVVVPVVVIWRDKPWTTLTKWNRKTTSGKTTCRNTLTIKPHSQPPPPPKPRIHWNTISPKFCPKSATRSRITNLASEIRMYGIPWDLSGSS